MGERVEILKQGIWYEQIKPNGVMEGITSYVSPKADTGVPSEGYFPKDFNETLAGIIEGRGLRGDSACVSINLADTSKFRVLSVDEAEKVERNYAMYLDMGYRNTMSWTLSGRGMVWGR